jgi:hypothetical protein
MSSASKVDGVYYFEYPSGHIPSTVPFTTWSGLLAVPPDSPYAERLKTKCGGTVMTNTEIRKEREPDGRIKKKKETDANGKDIETELELAIGGPGWIKGFWTAPQNWPEMAAGRE